MGKEIKHLRSPNINASHLEVLFLPLVLMNYSQIQLNTPRSKPFDEAFIKRGTLDTSVALNSVRHDC